jgi:hypothetical protein
MSNTRNAAVHMSSVATERVRGQTHVFAMEQISSRVFIVQDSIILDFN